MRHKIENYYNSPYFYVGVANVESLAAYASTRRRTGGFLEAMLEGNLYKAAQNADVHNQQRMFHIARHIIDTLPAESYGTPEKVKKWINRK